MRAFWILVAFLVALPPVADAQPTVRVQLVHNSARNPRPLFRKAQQPFLSVGIKLRLAGVVRRRMTRPETPGIDMMLHYLPVFYATAQAGTRTVILTRPPLDPWGREVLSGVANICGAFAVVSWWKGNQDAVASVLAHELGHTLGALHDAGKNVMNPARSDGGWKFNDRAVGEMFACREDG